MPSFLKDVLKVDKSFGSTRLLFVVVLLPFFQANAAVPLRENWLRKGIKQVYIEDGYSGQQIKELIRQLQVRAILDLGKRVPIRKGHLPLINDTGDPRGRYRWNGFEFPDGTLKDALNEFFKTRPEYRWRIVKEGVITIEPAERTGRIIPMLSRRFAQPTKAVQDNGVFVVDIYAIEKAIEDTFVGKGGVSRVAVYYGQGIAANKSLLWPVPLLVKSRRPFEIHSPMDFIKDWVLQNQSVFVVLEETCGRAVGEPARYEIALGSWNPSLSTLPTETVVQGLVPTSNIPPGYSIPVLRSTECMSEITRRYHYRQHEVIRAMEEGDIIAKAFMEFGFVHWLCEIDANAFVPRIFAAWEKLPPDIKNREATLLLLPSPLDDYKAPSAKDAILPFWKKLSTSNEKTVKSYALRLLKAYRKRVQYYADPKTVEMMKDALLQGDEHSALGALYALQYEIGSVKSAEAIAMYVFSKGWPNQEGPYIICQAVSDIAGGREAAINKLLSELANASDEIVGRIHRTLLLLTRDKGAETIGSQDATQIRAFWKKWQERK